MRERDLTPEQKLELDKIRRDFDADIRDLANRYEQQRHDRFRACNEALHDFWAKVMEPEAGKEKFE